MIIQSKNVWVNEKFSQCQIEITGQKITKIQAYNQEKADYDYGEAKIIPGLVDIHLHGYNGMDCNYVNEKQFKEWTIELAKEGITSFVPSTSTAPEQNFIAII